MKVWIYAVVAAPHDGGPAARVDRLRIDGVSGAPVRLVTVNGISAAVSDLARLPAPVELNLRRYDAVVQRLHQRFPATLPARFGTVASDLDELAFILRTRAASLREALRHVRRRTQMTIRVRGVVMTQSPDEAAQAHRLPDVAPDLRPSGRAYLRSRAAAAARARAIPGFDPVARAVRRWVRDERVEHRAGVATIYHLVPRGAASAYERAARAAAHASQVPVVVTGPFPPYAFSGW